MRFPKPARGRRVPGQMNRTEQAYSFVLEARRQAGEVLAWYFEEWTFKLGPDVRYTPDFIVMLADGQLEFHETKGTFVRDDARAKFRVACGKLPLIGRWCVYDKKCWTVTTPFPDDTTS